MGLTFSACKNWIAPRTWQSAGFDIGAFIVTTRYTHNVKTFAALTAPGNYLHSTEHIKWLIWYSETTARVVCANVLYFPKIPRRIEYIFYLYFFLIEIVVGRFYCPWVPPSKFLITLELPSLLRLEADYRTLSLKPMDTSLPYVSVRSDKSW